MQRILGIGIAATFLMTSLAAGAATQRAPDRGGHDRGQRVVETRERGRDTSRRPPQRRAQTAPRAPYAQRQAAPPVRAYAPPRRATQVIHRPAPPVRAPVQRYRAPARYVAPRGYTARRWSTGQRLPPSYYARPYVVDYRPYGLRPPPRGHHWVRVNNDVILVALATGLISQVISDLFYY